ncbi:MAG: sugar porter family MFS transporter [Phycisphaerae bacterium]
MQGAITTNAGSESGVRYNAGYVWMIATVAALGGLLFGYDWVVIGGAKPFFEKYFQLNSEELVGWANSCALIGCLLGSLASGVLSDRFGRKKLLILSAILFAVSSVLTGWAYSFAAFIAWRILGGVAIGMASNVAPMYISEISPAPWRGRLVALNQLTLVVGILAADAVNWMIAQPVPAEATAEMIRQSWNGQFGWRWMFTAVAVPSLVFFFASLGVPESPRWLLGKGKGERAKKVLARIGGEAYAEEACVAIEGTLEADRAPRAGMAELFRPGVAKILAIGVFLAVLQQWSGINVIFNYAQEIYQGAGYGVSDVLFNIVITGTVNLVFTLIGLGTVDKLGRRALMLIGCAGVGLSHVLIAGAYLAGLKGLPILILTLCAIGCYAMSLAPITWVLISEIFPNRIRGAAISVAVSALWIACFVLTFTFPMLNKGLGAPGTFFLYGGICLVGFVVVMMKVPETKGKSLEVIERELAGGVG